jgi:hypothetical protein
MQKAQTIAVQHQFKVETMKFIIKHDIQTGLAIVVQVFPPYPEGFDLYDTPEQAHARAANDFARLSNGPDGENLRMKRLYEQWPDMENDLADLDWADELAIKLVRRENRLLYMKGKYFAAANRDGVFGYSTQVSEIADELRKATKRKTEKKMVLIDG